SFNAATSSVTFNSTIVGRTVTSAGKPFNTVIFNGVANASWVLQDSMTVLSSMTLTLGSLDTSAANSFGMNIGGSWINNGGKFFANKSTITFTATDIGQRVTSRGFPFNKIDIAGTAGGYYTLIDSMTVSTMTVTAGNTLDIGGLDLTGL